MQSKMLSMRMRQAAQAPAAGKPSAAPIKRGVSRAVRLAVAAKAVDFPVKVFPKQLVKFADTEEFIVQGGRDKFALLPKAFEGIKKIGVIGWGSQAPAQAQNLRDSFAEAGADVQVTIGLRQSSPSWAEAEDCGFKKADGTLGEVFDVISESDMVVLLISDAAQVGAGRRRTRRPIWGRALLAGNATSRALHRGARAQACAGRAQARAWAAIRSRGPPTCPPACPPARRPSCTPRCWPP
jgi:hypothetical protein